MIRVDKINSDSKRGMKYFSFNTNIFQSPQMFKVYQKTKNYEPLFLVAVNEEEEVVGSLLAVIQKEHSGFLGKFSARSIIMGGPVVKDNDTVVLDYLLKEYLKQIKGKAIYTQVRNFVDQSWAKKTFEENGFNYEPHLDIIHYIDQPLDKQFSMIHKGRRKNIRRAERAGVIFKEINTEKEFDQAIELVASTYKRVKLPMPPKSFFFNSLEYLTSDVLKTFIAEYKREIIGCRMVLCYNDLIYDWYAGASGKYLNLYPNDFLPWKILEWGHNNGYKIFDFGGAGKPGVPYGVRDHKMKFGGELVEFGRFEKIHNKLLLQIGKFGLALYKRVI